MMLILAYAFTPCKAQVTDTVPEGYRYLPGLPFIICAEKDVQNDSIMTDSLFDQPALGIQFPVNRYDVDPNSPFVQTFNRQVVPFLRNNQLQLVRLFIRGAASPEGSYKRNQMLANKRAEALVNLLQAGDSISQPILTEATAEDYDRLLTLMQQASDPDYDQVKALYEEHRHDLALFKTKFMAKRDLWNRLLKQYFPQLRQARVVFLYKHRDDVLPEATLPKIQTIEPNEAGIVGIDHTLPPLDICVAQTNTMEPRREFLSVKTNLLFDGAYVPGYDAICPIPNVAIEYYPLKGHFTYGASFDCPWWQHYDTHKYFQIRNYQLHTRYYLRSGDIRKRGIGNGAAFKGLYLSAYVHAGLYSICFDANRGWEGEGYGGGLGLGYVVGLSKKQHWRLEIGAQVGFFQTRYDPYQWLCPIQPETDPERYYYKWYGTADSFKRRQHRYSWLGPTRIDITLSYDLLYRRIHRKGVSFRNKETKVP